MCLKLQIEIIYEIFLRIFKDIWHKYFNEFIELNFISTNLCLHLSNLRQALSGRQIERQKERKADRQTGRGTNRQADRETDSKTTSGNRHRELSRGRTDTSPALSPRQDIVVYFYICWYKFVNEQQAGHHAAPFSNKMSRKAINLPCVFISDSEKECKCMRKIKKHAVCKRNESNLDTSTLQTGILTDFPICIFVCAIFFFIHILYIYFSQFLRCECKQLSRARQTSLAFDKYYK